MSRQRKIEFACAIIVCLVVIFTNYPHTSVSVKTTSTTSQSADNVLVSTTTISVTQTKVVDTTPAFTMADVEMHSDSASCYTVINQKVYDLTSFISQHPGGEGAILSICGKDGTSAFERQHSGQSKPEQELATLFIGNLAQ